MSTGGSSNVGRALGQAHQTANGYASASNLVKAFRLARELPEKITEHELETDNAYMYFVQICQWSANRLIPLKFKIVKDDKNMFVRLEPSKEGQKRILVPGTIIDYIGKHLTELRKAFPNHPDWVHGRDPEWWTGMRANFKRECDRYQYRHIGDDNVFGDSDIRPIYWINAEGNQEDPRVKWDLRKVFIELVIGALPTNTFITTLAILLTTSDAIGRGGEVKFQAYNDWSYDPFLQITNTPWIEPKTLDVYALPRIVDSLYWMFDWYWAMGAYAMCDDGLRREAAQITAGIHNAVFPSLHRMNDANVSKWMTTILRRFFPEEMKNEIAATSLRKGGINQLAMHPDITLFDVTSRSGHSTGTTLDSYLDRRNPARGLPAAKALHGATDLKAEIVLPRLEAVGEHNMPQMEKLLGVMFDVTIVHFMPGGKLRPVLHLFAASLMRHNAQVDKDCKGPANKVSTALRAAFRKAEITDPSVGLSPEGVLVEWGKLVEEDYQQRLHQSKVAVLKDDSESRMVYPLLVSMAKDLKDIKQQQRGMIVENASQKATISQMYNQVDVLKGVTTQLTVKTRELSLKNARLKVELAQATNKLTFFQTPERVPPPSLPAFPLGFSNEPTGVGGPLTSIAAARELNFSEDADAFDVIDTDVSEAMALNVRNNDTEVDIPPQAAVASVSASIEPTGLSYNNNSRVVAENDGKNGGEFFQGCLVTLSEQGCINASSLSASTIPPSFKKNSSYLTHCLGLAEYVGEQDDIDILGNRDSSIGDQKSAASRIETACMKKMFEFEERVTVTSRLTPKVLGLGKRIRKYRNKILEAKGIEKGNALEEPFIEVSALAALERGKAPGTPEGIHSITQFTHAGLKKRARSKSTDK